ncbi:MAG TPA: biotin transporter BioY [Dehalococcoidales bacterium]|nr:biotin transporter BioY [Dehalococcoidales bacterium]
MAVSTWERWQMTRYSAYRWRDELSLIKKIALVIGMAAITGLAAQVRVPLPWTPVPITGQTLAALLAGVLLGRWYGGLSMAIYAGLGAAGLVWFSGWSGGIGHLAGPTGGYIVGFILAALFLGYVSNKYPKARSLPAMLGLMLFADFVLIYVPGLLQLHLWLNLVRGQTTSLYQVLGMGLFPFVVGDLIKVITAAGIAWLVIPRPVAPKGGTLQC